MGSGSTGFIIIGMKAVFAVDLFIYFEKQPFKHLLNWLQDLPGLCWFLTPAPVPVGSQQEDRSSQFVIVTPLSHLKSTKTN